MKLILQADLCANISERWNRQYASTISYSMDDSKKFISKKLAARKDLTAAEIDAIIGNKTWTTKTCDECSKPFPNVIELRDHGEFVICFDCLKKAMRHASLVDDANKDGNMKYCVVDAIKLSDKVPCVVDDKGMTKKDCEELTLLESKGKTHKDCMYYVNESEVGESDIFPASQDMPNLDIASTPMSADFSKFLDNIISKDYHDHGLIPIRITAVAEDLRAKHFPTGIELENRQLKALVDKLKGCGNCDKNATRCKECRRNESIPKKRRGLIDCWREKN